MSRLGTRAGENNRCRNLPRARQHPTPRLRAAESIAIAVIEDNRLVREGITALLNQVADLEVVAGASGGDLALLSERTPNVVLLDLGLPNGDSLRVGERVRKEFPESRVIVMDLLPVHEDIMEFVHAGVSGFIMKDAPSRSW